MKRLLLLLAGLLSACDAIPADPEQTLHKVQARGTFRVGIIDPGEEPMGQPQLGRFLGSVARAAGARPQVQLGAAEPLLTELEEGELDLVVGPVSRSSPWRTRVSPLPPLWKSKDGSRIELTAFARNGENRWIDLLYRQARAAGSVP